MEKPKKQRSMRNVATDNMINKESHVLIKQKKERVNALDKKKKTCCYTHTHGVCSLGHTVTCEYAIVIVGNIM